MAPVFLPVPDWFSWENQGAGVAVADLAGQQHLVVLAVDDGAQQNRGVYRLGHGLTGDGVQGGWTPWIDVPDWFSWANQGADVAVADLNGDGGRDLVVLMVDDGPQQNRGLYRVGRDLQADGTVGGWTPWVEVPDWFSWRNQGAGIAVTPPDAQGSRDLVVFMIDDADELNRGLYRIGHGLAVDGSVQGWTGWKDVPGWFSWFNAGGGVAVTDLDHNGGRDLVVMQIDDAVEVDGSSGQNQGFFRIGRGLGADGNIDEHDWGADWLGVPHWFSWTNQGGAATVAEIGGVTRLVAIMVDAPPGQNSGHYQLVDLDQAPEVYGSWEVKPFFSHVLPVHAALLPGGDVLFFAGSGSSKVRFDSPKFGDVGQGVALSTVWSPPNDSFVEPDTLFAAVDHRPFDLFCGGDALLADGRLLSAGGTRQYAFTGRDDVAVFNPNTRDWSFVAPMAHSRWYPTLITLADGRVLATTGLDEHGGGTSKGVVEIYDPALDKWQNPMHIAGGGLPLYAHLFLMEDGRIFFSGGRMDDGPEIGPCILDLGHDPVTAEQVPNLLVPLLRNQSASVLLPPAQDQRAMIIGGGPPGKPDKTYATDLTDVADLSAGDPGYVVGPTMCLGRMHLNAVLLPDRTVFVSGGSLKQEDEPLARLQAELFDPAANAWRLMATATVPRLYHSTALLLPDGRVVAAGGNPEGGKSVTWLPPDEDEEMQLEVFSPPYLFRGPRPVIDAAPETSHYGASITISTRQARDVKWVSLVRNGVTTHSFDAGQRLVDLPVTARTDATVQAAVPQNPNLAPPGWYMLFLVDRDGVPSDAGWVRLTA